MKDLFTDIWPIGHKIKGRYEIKDIKVGGMAVVYICFDHEFREYVAVKTFKNQFLKDKALVDRFFFEAETWMRLEKHRNIVWAKWVDNVISRPHIFMEYIEGDKEYGTDLRGWIKKKALNIESSLNFAVQICTGMIYVQKKMEAMKRPFVHRDIKPENILIANNRTAKITDFGLAKAYSEAQMDIEEKIIINKWENKDFSFTKTGKKCGTPPYMSPEQWMGLKELDTRSDIYSFGCVLYEMLANMPPFICRSFDEFEEYHLNARAVPLKKLNPIVPSELNNLAHRCIEKRPEERYNSFEIIREELNNIHFSISGRRLEYHDEGDELNAADLSNIAMSLQELGKSRESIEYYDRIIARLVDELSPDMAARGFNNRGNCYYSLGSYEKALANYELAKRIDSNYDLPWYNSASCYVHIGSYQKALDECNQAIRINQGYADSYALRAEIYLYYGDIKAAIEDCTKAIELEKRNVWAYRTRARSYEKLNEKEKAMADYAMAEKLSAK